MVIAPHRRKHHARWTPAALGPSLLAWAEGTSFTSADGTEISTWPDLSGNEKHWTQATQSRRPTQQTQNGIRVARFDAVDDGMVGSLVISANPFTLVAAYRAASTAWAFRRAVQGGTNNWLIGPYQSFYRYYDGSGFVTSSVAATTDFVIHSVSQQTSPSNRVSHWVNGTLSGELSRSGLAPGAVCLGASGVWLEPLNGDFYGLVAISGSSAQSRQLAEGYLAWALGIQTSLEASHPYRTTPP